MANNQNKNVYHMMLGLPPSATPPDHYQLLRLEYFEDDEQTIRDAALDANRDLLKWQCSDYHAEADRLMGELVAAREVLLSPRRKERYDDRLRKKLGINPAAQTTSEIEAEPLPVQITPPPALRLQGKSQLPPVVRKRGTARGAGKHVRKRQSGASDVFTGVKTLVLQFHWQIGFGKLIFVVLLVAAIVVGMKHVQSRPTYATTGSPEYRTVVIHTGNGADITIKLSTMAGAPLARMMGAEPIEPFKGTGTFIVEEGRAVVRGEIVKGAIHVFSVHLDGQPIEVSFWGQ